MNAAADWLECEYWSDVIAVRPEETMQLRIADSADVRNRHPRYLDRPYGDDERQQLDLFVPNSGGPWPLLVFIHGGYWQLGHKNEWAALASGWLDKNVAVAMVGYRLAPAATLADIASDVRASIDWLRAEAGNIGLDMHRLVISGISAGAHLASMTVVGKGRTACAGVALLSGVYDPRPLATTTPGRVIGDSLSAALPDISPYGHPPPDCRSMIAWGAEETSVFVNQSLALKRYWQNWGYAAPAIPIGGENHFTISNCLLPAERGPVVEFIESCLSPG